MFVASVQLRRGRPARWIALALVGLLAVLVSCQEQRDYKVLSFFFDGVPDPNAPPPAQATAVRFSAARPLELTPSRAYQHKPFALGQCSQCHQADRKQLNKLSSVDLCVKCHTNTTHEFAVMHGPVAQSLCLWCHDPHESDQPHLLKSVGSDLCLQCHDRELLPPQNPAHQSETAVCLDCHLGHGGRDHDLLRSPQSPIAALPTTRLATEPAAGGGP
jgi:predicted CXXCH cytochrome family protein